MHASSDGANPFPGVIHSFLVRHHFASESASAIPSFQASSLSHSTLVPAMARFDLRDSIPEIPLRRSPLSRQFLFCPVSPAVAIGLAASKRPSRVEFCSLSCRNNVVAGKRLTCFLCDFRPSSIALLKYSFICGHRAEKFGEGVARLNAEDKPFRSARCGMKTCRRRWTFAKASRICVLAVASR